MILSVSRRTDIPNYYADWFLERIKEGFAYVKNPMNSHQISRVPLSRKVVDCIVFWTKNPEPLIKRLDKIADYPCYFQFTLNGYGNDVEPAFSDKSRILSTFHTLSERIGRDHIVWRYDPILFNSKYDAAFHLRTFEKMAESLSGYTEQVVISFVDFYVKTKRNTRHLALRCPAEEEMVQLAGQLAQIAKRCSMKIVSCGEPLELCGVGVEHGSCIDKTRLERILGCTLDLKKDRNRRDGCGCYESVDLGTYHTCPGGCRYCYANFSEARVRQTQKLYDKFAPLLCGTVNPGDKITERAISVPLVLSPKK